LMRLKNFAADQLRCARRHHHHWFHLTSLFWACL
jgi:hypothetical protein